MSDAVYSVNLSWFHGFLPKDTTFFTFDDAGNKTKRTIPAGTLIRAYKGWIGPADKSSGFPSPQQDVWWTEVAPADGEFWSLYKESPQQKALMQSQAFLNDAEDRQKRNGFAQFDVNTLILPEIKGLTDADLSSASAKPRKPDYRKLTPQEIIDAANGAQSAGGFPWWLVIVGIGGVWYYNRKSKGEA
jgi:hypothetical protein